MLAVILCFFFPLLRVFCPVILGLDNVPCYIGLWHDRLFRYFVGIDEISVDVYKGVEHSDSEDTDKSDSSESEYASDEEQKTKNGQDPAPSEEPQKGPTKTKVKDQTSPGTDEEGRADLLVATESADAGATVSDAQTKEKTSGELEKESPEKSKAPPESAAPREKSQVKLEAKQTVPVEDSDSERELVIDLGEEQGGKERKRSRKDSATVKDSNTGKVEGDIYTFSLCLTRNHLTLNAIFIFL